MERTTPALEKPATQEAQGNHPRVELARVPAALEHDPKRAVAHVLRHSQRVLITGHADPDGDVAGGCSALYVALSTLGKQPTLYNPDPFPAGYRHLPGAQHLVHRLPPDQAYDATIILDAAHPEKVDTYLPRPAQLRGTVLWVDHHDRTGPSGDVEWIDVEAAAMAEMLFPLFEELGVTVDASIGMGLYATLIADTGGFRYESTTQAALNLAARLVGLGVKPWDVAEQVYERQPVERVRLLSRVLATLHVGHSGRFACVTLSLNDLQDTGATAAMADGMINHARGIDGVEMAAQLEELGAQRWRVTLRSRGFLEAGAVARVLGERGHRFGASFVLHGGRDAVAKKLEDAVDHVVATAPLPG